MRRFLLVLSVAALAGLAAWWSFSRAADSHAPTQPVESKSQPSAKDMASAIPNRTASSMAGAAKPSQAFFDPLEIAPCALTPISEQDVSSQVDGIFNEVLVDVGHQVRKGDLLGRLDDRQLRAQVDLLTIRAASESSERIAKAQYDEADAKLQVSKKSNETSFRSVADLEAKTYFCQRERFAFEIKKAREEREAAQKEVEKAKVVLQQHEIRAGLAGEILKVYKRNGEAVKQAEPIFRIVNCNFLRIEGLCKIQQASLIRTGMRALVEPEVRGEQMTQLIGHTGAITSLAVSPDGRLIASASEDRSVILWDWPEGASHAQLAHTTEVTAVAFAPAQVDGYTLLTGSGDGKGLLWRVPYAGSPTSLALAEQHERPIRAVAFNGTGTLCATVGDDKRIGIWECVTGKLLYWLHAEEALSAHQGAVTSVRFCPDGQLVSAGRDNSVKVWKLGADRGSLVRVHAGRTCEVAQLGVSPEGRRLLLDLGDEMRILDRDNGNCLGSFHNHRQGRFQGLAEFSPSGRLVLTASSNQRLQLWRVPPTPEETLSFRQWYAQGFHRGSLLALQAGPLGLPSAALAAPQGITPQLWNLSGGEVRHFVIPNASLINTGVFAPDESAFFTAGTDKIVRVWAAPATSQWQPPYEARITYVGNQIERGTDMVRIRAELENPADPARRLRSGMFATLRIFPETAELK